MGEKSQFKLIGVRPLKGCASHIRKILKEDSTYFIYNEYEVNPESPELIRERKGVDPIHKTFFSYGEHSPLISISAIVGKNGDGKSTIVELIMRILNNFAYYSGFKRKQTTLVPVDGLNAILYYSMNNEIYSIESNNNGVRFSGSKKIINFNNQDSVSEDFEKIKDLLFYTQISNYSLYAYNDRELRKEYTDDNKCWINGIFHKNDAYQTPIVLHPWRNSGVIDINKENSLTKQRLVSLFINDNNEKSIRQISEKQNARYLIFNAFEKSKLEIVSIYEYYFETIDVDILEFQTNDALTYNNTINFSKYNLFKDTHFAFLKNLRSYIDLHPDDFNFAYTAIKDEIPEFPTDFNRYLDAISQVITQKDKQIINYFSKKGYRAFTFSLILRISLIIELKNIWNNLLGGFDKGNLYNSDLISKAKEYVIYKTISIFDKYPQYKLTEPVTTMKTLSELFKSNLYFNDLENLNNQCFEILIKDLYTEKSHISLKLKQTLNYIKYNKAYYYIDEQKDKDVEQINSLKIESTFRADDSFLIDLNKYRTRLEKLILIENEQFAINKKDKLSIIELLPPPIFDIDIVLEIKDNTNDFSLLSQLSSGERQKLNNVSSVIYHLQNINSTSNKVDDIVKYKHINLFFEEIELYFHPEYQRQYIDYLLSQISKANLNQIDSINICFVTHSPFMLSDIPKNNVLFLQNGDPTRQMQEDTFGGNIHTLLQNGFFLDGVPVGEFAKKKINSLFERLHKGKTSFKAGSENEFYNQILLVSEPFLRSQLLKLFHELQPKNVISLEKEVKLLRIELENIKKMIQ